MAKRMSEAGRRATIVAAAGMVSGIAAGVVTGVASGDAGLGWAIGGATALLLSGAGTVGTATRRRAR